eukprot:s4511_g11.t1
MSINDKAAKFKAIEITILKNLVQKHVADSEKKRVSLGLAGPAIAAAELERQCFNITLSSVRHDLELYKVWLTRSRDREAAMYFQEFAHAQARRKQRREIAAALMDRSSQTSKMEFSSLESANDCIKAIQSFKSQMAKMENLNAQNQIMTLVLLNWAAPSTFPVAMQRAQSTVCGSLVNASGTLGVVLTPVYFHKKGMLYKLEESANQMLSQANMNGDSRFAISLTGKNDERERRTFVQPGRFLWAMDDDLAKANQSAWQGVDAARKYLRSLSHGLDHLGAVPYGVRFEHTHTCEMAKAFVLESTKMPAYYCRSTAYEEKLDWSQQHMQSWLDQCSYRLPAHCRRRTFRQSKWKQLPHSRN